MDAEVPAAHAAQAIAIGAAAQSAGDSTKPSGAAASSNAASQWRELFPNLRFDDGNPLHMTDDDWGAISDLSVSNAPTMKEIERGRQAMEKLSPIMDQLVSTSKLRKCDFEHDFSQGFEMLLPELQPMRQAARVLRARGFLAMSDGDWNAFAESVGASSNLSRQLSQSPVLISSLVAGAVGGVAMEAPQALIDEGSLTPEKAESLLKELAPLRGEDPYGYSKSVSEEYKALLSMNVDGAKLVESLGATSDNEHFKNLDTAAIRQAMLPLAGIYQEAAAAMKEPNEEAAKKRWEAAWNSRDKLPKNTQVLAELVMPSIDRIIHSRFTSQDQIDALMASLQAIASGKVKPAALAVPALWWSRAAAAARALNEEQQAVVILQQLSSVTDDSPMLPLVVKTLDAADATVFECMRRAMACESKTISFDKTARSRNRLDLALIGGLRGAARMAMAKSLRTSDADKALAYLAMAFAASNALASDPTLAHALASQSIVDELADAVWRYAIRGGLNDEQRGKLDALIAAIPRSDAFGFTAAQKRARAALVDDLRYDFEQNSDAGAIVELRELLAKSLAQKPPAWLLATEILHSARPAEAGPEGALVSTDDLFAPETVKAMAAAWDKKHERNEVDEAKASKPAHPLPANTPAAQRVRKFINELNPPAMRDLSLDANRSGETLSNLDAAAAKRRPPGN
jgi:hypothetical protein